MTKEEGPLTVPKFVAMKAAGRKISMLTAYDHATAGLLDTAGVDGILVGDSLAMVVQGRNSTLAATLDQMIYHGEMVARAVRRALVVVDMPFPTCHVGACKAVESAGRILKETGCQAVKVEGGAEQADVIGALVSAGIPVMAHGGLRPQSVNVTGGYRVQREEARLLDDALAAEKAGAFAIVLECIPAEVAARISSRLKIPTIGIGAGPGCDGQVLVINDLLGLTSGYVPKFVKAYADLGAVVRHSVAQYCSDVRAGEFPGKQQSYE